MEDRLGSSFSAVANALSNFNKEARSEIENSKNRGKKDVFHESLKWMTESNEGDLKFVRLDDFLQHLRDQSGNRDACKNIFSANKKYKPCND